MRWRVHKNIRKKINSSKYIRGFSNKILKYDITNNNWELVATYDKRVQFGASIKIKNNIYIWGGYSYEPISEEEIKRLKILPPKSNITTQASGFIFSKNHAIFKKIWI